MTEASQWTSYLAACSACRETKCAAAGEGVEMSPKMIPKAAP
jgi:hypothetical protein